MLWKPLECKYNFFIKKNWSKWKHWLSGHSSCPTSSFLHVSIQPATLSTSCSNPNQTTNSELTFKIHSFSSSMAISSYSCSSYPSATLLNGTLHSSFTDLFISRTPLPINIKPKPILTTTQTYHYHPHKALEFSGYWKWRTGVSFFPSFLTKSKDSEALKEELFTAIAPLDRGAEATAQDQELVDQVMMMMTMFDYFILIRKLKLSFTLIFCDFFLFIDLDCKKTWGCE